MWAPSRSPIRRKDAAPAHIEGDGRIKSTGAALKKLLYPHLDGDETVESHRFGLAFAENEDLEGRVRGQAQNTKANSLRIKTFSSGWHGMSLDR